MNNATQRHDYQRHDLATIGVGRTVAYALAVLGIEAVQRSTIRALLPQGEIKPRGLDRRQRLRQGETASRRKNKTSMRFGEVLLRLERLGWVRRSPDLVYVTDRAALLKYALQGHPTAPQGLLDIAAALSSVQAEQGTPHPALAGALIEQRRQELKALTRLMQAPASGAQSVRIIHKPQLI